jgi:hypothetical protein
MKMRINLALTCYAHAYLGIGMTVQFLGIDAGLSPELIFGIFISSIVFFIVVVVTAMEKVKKELFKNDELEEDDFND